MRYLFAAALVLTFAGTSEACGRRAARRAPAGYAAVASTTVTTRSYAGPVYHDRRGPVRRFAGWIRSR